MSRTPFNWMKMSRTPFNWMIFLLISTFISYTAGEEEEVFPPANYNKKESGEHGQAQSISVTMAIESVPKVDVSAMEFIVRGYVIQEWNDHRLNHSVAHPMLTSDQSLIWIPDLYCMNCGASTLNQILNKNLIIRIHPNGDVYFSQLAHLDASCHMELEKFPFDKQVCTLQLASYGYSNEYVTYRWNSTPTVHQAQLEQLTVSSKVTARAETIQYPAGKFIVLSLELYFTRQMGFYILHVFIPCAVLVCLSWMLLYMKAADIGDRLSIGVTLILTMIFLLGYINQSLPKVSYIKAVDWYVIFSLAMIVLSVLESVFVYWLLHKKGAHNIDSENATFERFGSYITGRLSMSSAAMLPNLYRERQLAERNSLPTSVETPNQCTKRKHSAIKITEPEQNELIEQEKFIKENGKSDSSKSQSRNSGMQETQSVETVDENDSIEGLQNMNLVWKVDYGNRFIFPMVYIIFNAVFVWFYMKES